jgi:aminopeptidase N
MLRDAPKPTYLKDYRPPEFLVEHVDLEFDLGEDQTAVHARLSLRRNPAAQEGDGSIRLHGEGLSLQWLALDGARLSAAAYELDAVELRIPGVPERFLLESVVHLRPQDNKALEGLYRSGNLFCTQCEAEGFRKITFYPDRPDIMARFSTTIVADKQNYPVLLSNGNLVASDTLPGGRHRVRWDDPFPKPCYLFALVAGDLRHIEDSFTTCSGREVTLRLFVEPENIDKCDHAMRSLKKAMLWDESEYGREYDLDIYMIVAVNDFNMGAMENKGLNIFNSKYVLARPETATDQDYQGIEGVIAHEYFHNWTGNRITCRDWFQLSLKEGLTVFRDQEFSADMGSRGVKRIEDVRLLRAHQFPEDAGPMAHPVRPDSYIEINNFYTMTVYEKGAEVVRMQRNLLGPQDFRRATDLYFQRHDGQAVTTEDFVRCMEDASGRDLTQFRLWYTQAGTPRLQVTDEHDPATSTYRLHVTQSSPPSPGQPEKLPLHVPFAVGLLDGSGRSLPLRLEGERAAEASTRVLELFGTTETFCFMDLPERPVPSLLRGFSAPVKVEYDYRDEELMFLMAHDPDAFNRWDAAQTLSQRVILGLVEDLQSDRVPEVLAGFMAAFSNALADDDADPALLAEVLSLPSETYLGEQMDVVDVSGLHSAREAVRNAISRSLRDQLQSVYERSVGSGPYIPDPESIGRRALKNLCLGYLMQDPDAQASSLCLRQFEQADNMTDVMAALAALANADCPERAPALAAFADRWREDPLVMDKWFAIQATSRLQGTLDVVRGLMHHPCFSMTNPNRVRSLIGAFCSGNPVGFHASDGAGYRFLVDRVLELDPVNPQVAARLLRVMSRWRRYDAGRQGLMEAQLRRLLEVPELSRDVYEVVSKSLQLD